MISRHLAWEELLGHLTGRVDEMTDLLAGFVGIESPSGDPGAQEAMLNAVSAAAVERGLSAERLEGGDSGGHLLIGAGSDDERPHQLMVGHCDTVWPVGTLAARPAHRSPLLFHGPGAFDAKAGIVQALFAMEVLEETAVRPVLLVNSDEEIGSPTSRPHIERLAAAADRVFVLEPSLGPEGRLKTSRKGVGRYTITIRGRAAHVGLDPEKGASAVLELSHVVQELFRLNDPDAGVTVNVGMIDGGQRANVVAVSASAVVDVRVPNVGAGEWIDRRIRSLQPTVPGTALEVEGGFGRPPMGRTPGTAALFEQAVAIAQHLGFRLGEAAVGGGSDGNLTSAVAPTLDGLGAVGDAAHAEDEHVVIAEMPRRAALLAGLLSQPRLAVSPEAMAGAP